MDFGSIIRRSWDLTWKNKWLWVYGLVIATLTGSAGSSFGNSFSSSSKSSRTSSNSNLSLQLEQPLKDASNFFINWVTTVPFTTWLTLGLCLLTLIILGMFVSWLALAWAKGALVGGISDAQNDKKVNLENTTNYGLKYFKNLIVYGLIAMVITMGITFTLFAILGTGAFVLSFSQPLMIFWLVSAGGLGVIFLMIVYVLLAMVSIYAERLIVLEGFSPLNAWKKGLSLSRGNFLNTLLMGLINVGIGCGVGCLTTVIPLAILAVPGLLLFAGLFTGMFTIPSALGLGLFAMLFFAFNFVVRAAMVVFSYSNWNQLFKKIYAK